MAMLNNQMVTTPGPKRGKAPLLALNKMCNPAHGHPCVALLVPVRVSAAGDVGMGQNPGT